MILAIVTSVGVSGRRNETAIVDAALAASPYAGRVTGVFGIKAAPCDRVGERWAKARGLSLTIIQPGDLPLFPIYRAQVIAANCDAVLLIGGARDQGRLWQVRTQAEKAGKPCHWHVVGYSYDRWSDPA